MAAPDVCPKTEIDTQFEGMKLNTINTGDSLEWLKTLPDGVANTCVTSPPYFGLRSYLPDVVVLKKDAPDWVVEKLRELGVTPIDKK